MPANLEPPIEDTFILSKTDAFLKNEGEPTTVKIAQALQGDHDERMSLWAHFSRKYDDDGGVEVHQRISPSEVRRLEVFLTLKDCNLTYQGKPLFKFPLKRTEFDEAWKKLIPVIADEIHEKVLAVNPTWNGEGEG